MSAMYEYDHSKAYKDSDLTSELLARKNRWTPDYLQRKLEKHIPIFCYGTLKSGFPRHKILEGSVALGEAYTSTGNYTMEKVPVHDFPVVFDNGGPGVTGHRIYGEVYLIGIDHLINIDRIEDNGGMYKRETRFVYLPEQSFRGSEKMVRPTIRCWMYLGVKDFWKSIETEGMKSKTVPPDMRVYEWERESAFRPFNPGLLDKYEAETKERFFKGENGVYYPYATP